MRGAPLIRAALVIAVLIFMAFPIWRLTRKAEAVMPAQQQDAAASQSPVHIQLTFTHPALEFQVLHLGKVIWEGKQPGTTIGKDVPMEFPKEGIDLQVKAAWAPGTPETAVRVAVKHNYGSTDQTAWASDGVLNTVLTFTDPQ